MGTDEAPVVPQERSCIERLADWKRQQRSGLRGFVRGQISREYRAAAHAPRSDRKQTAQRVRLNVNTFAQVPLLNPEQLVTSWRELLPDHRDTEVRRVPLEVKEPGVYVVEAVTGLLRAYTIVDRVGHRPGDEDVARPDADVRRQPVHGEPVGGLRGPRARGQKPIGQRHDRRPTARFEATLPETRRGSILGLARCGDQIAATDPGSYGLSQPARELVGYIYTDKPIYRPGHTVHIKAVLRWRERDALLPFDRPKVELAVSDLNDKVVFRQRADAGCVRRRARHVAGAGDRRARLLHASASPAATRRPPAASRCRSTASPSSR